MPIPDEIMKELAEIIYNNHFYGSLDECRESAKLVIDKLREKGLLKEVNHANTKITT